MPSSMNVDIDLFNHNWIRFGLHGAWRRVIRDLADNDAAIFDSHFYWNGATREIQVELPDINALVPISDFGTMWFSEDRWTMYVWYGRRDRWVRVPEHLVNGVDFLLSVRHAARQQAFHERIHGPLAQPALLIGGVLPARPPSPRTIEEVITNSPTEELRAQMQAVIAQRHLLHPVPLTSTMPPARQEV